MSAPVSGRFDPLRRKVLGVAAAVPLLAAATALRAQDPNSGAAQRAARDWLAIVDRLDAAASWQAAGAKFQEAMNAEKWGKALQQVRGRLGPMQTRAVDSTKFARTVPTFPDSDYAVIVFRSSFQGKDIVWEKVTLERQDGGDWRVVGYSLS